MTGQGRNGGFTLIEVLVGLAILALLAGMIQGIYAAVARSREASEARTATIHASSAVLARLCDELAAAFVSKQRAQATQFTVATDQTKRSTLDFATLMPPIHGLRAGGETRVRYEIVPENENGREGGYVLKRAEVDDLAKDVGREGVTHEMLKGINRFTVKCFDGKEWVEEWQAGGPPDPRMPTAVKLEIAWGDPKNEQVFQTSATLYGAQ